MKPFAFRLSAVLRFREQRANEAVSRFAQAVHAQRQAEEARQHAEKEHSRWEDTRRDFAKTGGAAGDFEQMRRSASLLKIETERRVAAQSAAREATSNMRDQMLTARRNCEVLERLRMRQREEHEHSSNREEQANLDELATQRHNRRQP